MTSSEEDPRTKRGGQSLFDNSFFPDAVILSLRGHNFTVSASYLALHSPFFYDLFYGSDSNGLDERYDLDYDSHTFGDLLDIIYPCYKKTNCCVDCSLSLEDRLNIALQLKLKFAVKRMIIENSEARGDIVRIITENNAMDCYSDLFRPYPLKDEGTDRDERETSVPLPVAELFPDSTSIILSGGTVVVSASALSLHSPILCEMLYRDGKLANGIELDMGIDSFSTILQAIIGQFPSELRSEFLDDLLTLGAKNLYDFYLSEMMKKIIYEDRREASLNSMKILKHCSNQSNPDMNCVKSVIRFLERDEMEKILNEFTFLSVSENDQLKNYYEEAAVAKNSFQFYVKTLTGRTITFESCPFTLVLELKKKICVKTRIPVDQQRLIYAGAQLQDSMTLGDCGVQEESTVHLIKTTSKFYCQNVLIRRIAALAFKPACDYRTICHRYWSIRVVDIVRTNMFSFDDRLDMSCGPFKKHQPLRLNWSCQCSLFKALRSIPSTPGVLNVAILLGHGCITKTKKDQNAVEKWHQLIASDEKHKCEKCTNRDILLEDVVNMIENTRANVLLCYLACRSPWNESDREKLEELNVHKFVHSTPKIGILYFTKQGSVAHCSAEMHPMRRMLLLVLSLATQGGDCGTSESIKRSISFIASAEFSPRVKPSELFDIDLHDKWLA